MMMRIQEDRARSGVKERRIKEEGVTGTEEKELSNAEQKSRKSLERQEEIEAVGVEPAEEDPQVEERSTSVLVEDEVSQSIPEEPKDEPQGMEGEIIKRCEGLDTAMFYTQTVHALDENVGESTPREEGETASAERPPPVIYQSDGCCEEEGKPELMEEKTRR